MSEKKYQNGLGIASMIVFIVGMLILGLGFLLTYLDGSEYSGFFIVFAIWIGGLPLLVSGILALINIINFYSKKSVKKCSKFFLILDWIIISIILLPIICLQIYNIFGFLFL
ncbi:MAG: hypothetical protein MR031_00075 [Tenericutes bacterium]|nr:hypothetical protein [Mycoplasmatota bacterium]